MGRELACGAHLESLRRTAVAEFTLEDAHTLEDLAQLYRREENRQPSHEICHPDRSSSFLEGETSEVEGPAVASAPDLESLFIHPRKLLPLFPSVTADEATAARIRSGRTINLPDLSRARQVKVFASQRDLIAIATRVAGTLFHPKIVLCG